MGVVTAIAAGVGLIASGRASKKAERGFCKKCGASILFKMNKSNIISI